MADVSFADVKVHNELEYCAVEDLNIKKQLERLFLSHRISYYEKWEDTNFLAKFFAKNSSESCVICINEMQKDKADELLACHPELKSGITMVGKRVGKTYF